MFPQNLHTHTVFGDGRHTPEDMALGAIRAGLRSLGFSLRRCRSLISR